jgi:hypothetical protein
MNGLDGLLHKAIFQAIQNEIDAKEILHMEQKLRQDGIKFSEIITKFGQVKKQSFYFEHELKKVEDRVLRNFLLVESDPVESWVVIKNKHLTELILKTFADEDKKIILDLTRTSPETIPNVLSLCNLPNTSGYRKMKQLIDDGFVMPTGLAETFEGRRALLYKSIIQKIQIIINKSDIFAKILVPKETLSSSQMVRMIVELEQGKRTMAN